VRARAHLGVQLLLLGDDSRHETRRPRLHQPPRDLFQSCDVLALAPVLGVQLELGEVDPIRPVYLHVNQSGREDVSVQVYRAGRGEVGGEEGGLAGDDLAGGGGDVEVGTDALAAPKGGKSAHRDH
jgi:hypothetical protein